MGETRTGTLGPAGTGRVDGGSEMSRGQGQGEVEGATDRRERSRSSRAPVHDQDAPRAVAMTGGDGSAPAIDDADMDGSSAGRHWRAFWDGDNSIYVSARHRDRHYACIAADIAALVPSRTSVVLDYGCGEALHADRVAAGCASLLLYDPATTTRDKLHRRFAAAPGVRVIDRREMAALPDRSLDMIVCNSVLQYVGRDDLGGLLSAWRAKLKPGALLVLGDVVPTGSGPVTDAFALVAFAARRGFVLAALLGLTTTFFSSYRKLRTSIGLSTYAEADVMGTLTRYGFAPKRVARNIGHNQARMTFVAERV